MMNGNMKARYALDHDSGLVIAELPYRDRTKALVLLLPAQRDNALTQLKRELGPRNLEKWIAATKRGDVGVHLPKFSFRASHELKEPLAAMGAKNIFDLATADFSGIANQPLAIQAVYHGAFIKVDESGTEAAAATAVVGFGAMRSPIAELIVDRPFLLLIRDLTTGCILFVGQVGDPRAAQ
jgi:serpin B